MVKLLESENKKERTEFAELICFCSFGILPCPSQKAKRLSSDRPRPQLPGGLHADHRPRGDGHLCDARDTQETPPLSLSFDMNALRQLRIEMCILGWCSLEVGKLPLWF